MLLMFEISHKFLLTSQKVETPTLKEFISEIGSAISVTPEFYVATSESDSDTEESPNQLRFEYYPSVDFGSITANKFSSLFGWNPTNLKSAIKESSNWFLDSWQNFPTKRPVDDFPESAVEILEAMYNKKD
jgi:hypothetical protein